MSISLLIYDVFFKLFRKKLNSYTKFPYNFIINILKLKKNKYLKMYNIGNLSIQSNKSDYKQVSLEDKIKTDYGLFILQLLSYKRVNIDSLITSTVDRTQLYNNLYFGKNDIEYYISLEKKINKLKRRPNNESIPRN